MNKSNYIEINERAYDCLVQYYIDIFNDPVSQKIKSEIFEGILRAYAKINNRHFIPCDEPLSILDLGSGVGIAIQSFLSLLPNSKIVPLELSENMRLACNERFEHIPVMRSNILDVEQKEYANQFDVVYASAFIHLFSPEDAVKVLDKINSWLKSNGVLYISTTLHNNPSDFKATIKKEVKTANIERYRMRYSKEVFIKLLTDNGFVVLESSEREEKTTDKTKLWLNVICKKEVADYERKTESDKETLRQ